MHKTSFLLIALLMLPAALSADSWVQLATPSESPFELPVSSDGSWRARDGKLRLTWNTEQLALFGLEAEQTAHSLSGELRFEAPAGDFRFARSSTLALADLGLRLSKRPLPNSELRLERADGEQGRWRLLDPKGAVWFELSHAHDQMDVALATLKLGNMDVFAGPALAASLGRREVEGMHLARAELDLRITERAAVVRESSCATPQWPSPPTRVADVALSGIDTVQILRGRNIDGPGGALDGELVISLSASLLNVGQADIPWYRKFVGPCSPTDSSGLCAPYGNDQHPFLVWSLIRMDATGRLEQISRSGLKHAFLSVNSGCDCDRNQILGLGCGDVYGVATNDTPFGATCTDPTVCYQGVRQELAPREVIWGRCGVFDPNCDGMQSDASSYGPFDRRLLVKESQIDPAANAGAKYFFDAWYVVRDDSNIFNSMGSVSVSPSWTPPNGSNPGFWTSHNNIGPFVQGSVIQRWLDAEPQPVAKQLITLDRPLGRVQVGVRVERGSLFAFRYVYVMQNLDYADTAFSGTAPNLRLERATGPRGLVMSKRLESQSLFFEFWDGDDSSTNNWINDFSGSQFEWRAPAGEHLRWGQLLSFTLEANGEPAAGSGQLIGGALGNEVIEQFSIFTPNTPRLFKDGFESQP
jgi:hypothetical protein